MPSAYKMISLTHTALLAGTALTALPVIAHLLHRRAKRRVVFPSVELLAAARSSAAAPMKMRRWLLLALRCAAIVLAVLAFARPLWTGFNDPAGSNTMAAGNNAIGAVVVVLDISASTAQRQGNTTVAALLRDQAQRELDAAAAAGDTANLIFAGATPQLAAEQLTRNPAMLSAALRDAKPQAPRADLASAITAAGALLAETPVGAGRHIVVLTDATTKQLGRCVRPSPT